MQLILGFYSGIGELVEIVNRVVELEHDGVAAKLQLSNAFLASWQAIYSAFALMSNSSLLTLYQLFKSNFSDSAQRADQRHLRMWENIDDSVYCWFESLTEEMNADMRGGQQHQTHAAIFDFFRQQFMLGDESVKNCIEVAWLEHLFWQVPAKFAVSDWHALPSVFKQLYIGFHQRSPIELPPS